MCSGEDKNFGSFVVYVSSSFLSFSLDSPATPSFLVVVVGEGGWGLFCFVLFLSRLTVLL